MPCSLLDIYLPTLVLCHIIVTIDHEVFESVMCLLLFRFVSVQDVEVEKQSHFAIVSMKTAASTTVSSLRPFLT